MDLAISIHHLPGFSGDGQGGRSPPVNPFTLSAAGQTRAMSVLTGQGAALEGLRPGAYELQLEQSDQKVAMLKVRLFAEDDPNA